MKRSPRRLRRLRYPRVRFGAVPAETEAPHVPGTRRCLYTIKQEFGHDLLARVSRHYWKPRGEFAYGRTYEICVTPRMHWTLFGGACSPYDGTCPPRNPKCGSYACVYPSRDPDKVVKITIDPTDVENLRIGQGLRYIPRLYAASTISSTAPVPVYALLVEKLATLGAGDIKRKAFRWNVCTREEAMPGDMPRAANIEKNADRAADWCCRDAGPHRAACLRLSRDLHQAIQRLQLRGVKWKDTHPGNIGWSVKDRCWKALDLGYASEKVEPEGLPHLQGSRRRR